MEHRVIILADRTGEELAPLDRDACPALLEVGGRCVIEYTLEDLAETGAEAAVIVSAHVESLREKLGDGGRWGLRLSYLLTRPGRSPGDCVRRVTGRGPVLLVRGDIVRGRSVGAFLESAPATTDSTVAAVSGGMDAGICLVNGVWTHGCTWPSFPLGVGVVELGDVGLFRLDSMRDLHAACLAASRGEIPGVDAAGRDLGDGRIKCRLSQSDGVDTANGRLLVGEGAKVSAGVIIDGTVMVGSGAFVDEGARLENSVVMPGTYVGRDVELKNAIISGRHLVRVDIGATAVVSDDFLLSPLRKAERRPRTSPLIDRAAAAALLVLSAPLWPVAALAGMAGGSRPRPARRTFISNRSQDGHQREFSVREFNTPVPLLRRLPWLLPVLTGDVRLIGVQPVEAGAAPSEEKRTLAGVIGPALLDVSADATDDEIALGEAVFERTLDRTKRLRYFVRGVGALFSTRAWSTAP